MEQEIIITNNNLLFHFSGHNNDLLVLKQWKRALNRITPSLLGLRAQALAYIYRVFTIDPKIILVRKEAMRHRQQKLCINEIYSHTGASFLKNLDNNFK